MGILSSTINALANSAQAGQQFEYDKQLAEQQNQFNLDMWNKQNEYNSPSAQMQRLVDAGLSPNLAYGNLSSGVSSKAPEMNAAGRNAPNLGVFNFNDPVLPFISKLSALQDLRGKMLANIDKAGQIAGKSIAFQNEYPDNGTSVFVERKQSLFDRFKDFLRPYNSPLQGYYAGLHQSLMHAPELKNMLMETNARNKSASTIYQNMVNDWFKADRIFNYVNGGLRSLSSFIPKTSFNIKRGGFDNRTLHEFINQ